MLEDPIDAALDALRARSAVALRAELSAAPPSVLQKLAVDLVPPLFHNGYTGAPLHAGDRFADAAALPAVAGLPRFLVRVHSGTVLEADAAGLLSAMDAGGSPQAALVVIADVPFAPGVKASLAARVPWIVDFDGLVNLMLNARLAMTIRAVEASYVNPAYFR